VPGISRRCTYLIIIRITATLSRALHTRRCTCAIGRSLSAILKRACTRGSQRAHSLSLSPSPFSYINPIFPAAAETLDIKSRIHRRGIFTGGSIPDRTISFDLMPCHGNCRSQGIRSALLTKSGVASHARKLRSPRRRSDAFPRRPAKSAGNHAEDPTTVDETSSRPPPFLSHVTGRTDVERISRDLPFAERQIGRA